jgi:TusA-related sulfurtransferase
MMTKIVDARKRCCPQPVVLTNEALREEETVVTIVDNEAAQHNVNRFAHSLGCEVTVAQRDDIVLLLSSEFLGQGYESLGSLLMHSFLNTLGGLTERPESIIFMNSGVKLVAEGSAVLGELRQLEGQGVEIMACGTCLSRLKLTDKLAVGRVSNMYTLTDTMLKAGKLIAL